MSTDDLLSSDEIEALMRAARSSADGGSSPAPAAPAPAPPPSPDLLDPNEIEALMQGSRPPAAATPSPSGSDLLDPKEIEALMQGNRPPSGSFGSSAKPAAKPFTNKPAAKAAPPTSVAPGPVAGAAAPPAKTGGIGTAAAAPGPGGGQFARNLPAELGQPSPLSLDQFAPPPPVKPVLAGSALESLQDLELDLRIELGRAELLIEEVLQLREGSVVPLDKLAGDPVDIIVNGRLVARGEVLVLNDNFCVRVAEIVSPD